MRSHVLSLLLFLLASNAQARRNGIAADDCAGCHSSGAEPAVTLTADPAAFSPGDVVVLTVRITAVNGSVGGMYLRSNGPGAFTLRSNQSTKLLGPDEVVHSAPKAASSGAVTFQVNWTAPSTPGGVAFDAYAVSANNNNAQSGDGASHASLQLVYGCTGQTYYRDFDADGVGAVVSGTILDCSTPPGYSAQSGDCHESDEKIYPGAPERCNGRDDDCDGEVDDGLAMNTFYRDADGDGFGSSAGGTRLSCDTPLGYSADDTDCDDSSKFVQPNAMELCNSRDDDCDGAIDESEGLVACGIGACMRTGTSCGGCLPGPRAAEICNGIDDDCDGVIDDEPKGCEEGQVCQEGACLSAEEVPDAGDGTTTTPPRPPAAAGCSTGGTALFPLLALWGLGVRRRTGAGRVSE